MPQLRASPAKFALGIILTILLTCFIQVLHLDKGFANISLLYLLLVFSLSIYAGRACAIFSAVLSFLCLNWFFIEPRHTFIVQSPSEWLTLTMFLLVSTITGHLTARLKASELEARRMHLRAENLALAREVLIKKQAQVEALAQADRLKTALLSMVSHDFRSPLTGIKAAVSVLQEESSTLRPFENAELKSLLQGIEQEADRLNRMVGNILDMSKLEAGAWRPMLESAAIEEIIGSTLSGFSETDNARVTIQLEEPVVEVFVDPVQIEQVLKNLVENALKYSPPESTVEIKVKTSDSELVMQVMDRGKGISDDDSKHIFDLFFRAKALNESSIPGVGIGLSICKALVEAHHGKIEASPREGGGTTVKVVIPSRNPDHQVSPGAINESTGN